MDRGNRGMRGRMEGRKTDLSRDIQTALSSNRGAHDGAMVTQEGGAGFTCADLHSSTSFHQCFSSPWSYDSKFAIR